MPTLAFSNSGNYWKTRYTFEPSCYASLDANLISFAATAANMLQYAGWLQEPLPEVLDEEGNIIQEAQEGIPAAAILAWIHNVGDLTEFYGAAAGSGIAICFNENVSTNKMFKSISLEGSSNLAASGFSVLTTNDTTVPGDATTTPIRPLQFKGGILYADVGRGQQNSQANIRAVASWAGTIEGGVLTNVTALDAGTGGSLQAGDALFIVNAAGQVFNGSGFTNAGDFNFGAVPVVTAANLADFGTVLFNQTMGVNGMNTFPNDAVGPFAILSRGATDSYGKSIQGQYGTLRIIMGAVDYELHAINAYYEPNSLDHRERNTTADQLSKLLKKGK